MYNLIMGGREDGSHFESTTANGFPHLTMNEKHTHTLTLLWLKLKLAVTVYELRQFSVLARLLVCLALSCNT